MRRSGYFPNIIFDDRITLRPRSGIAHYVAALLPKLQAILPDGSVTKLSEHWTSWPFHLLSHRAGAIGRQAKDTAPQRAAQLQRLSSYYDRVSGVFLNAEIFHAPDLFPSPNRADLTIVTVHDLTVLRFPQWHPEYRVSKYERHLSSLTPNWRYITNSNSTKDDLHQLLGVPLEHIKVIYLAARPGFTNATPTEITGLRDRLHLPDRYFLYLGTIEPRKNVETLLHAYAKLNPTLRRRFPLLLAGGWGWKSDRVETLLQQEPWRHDVRYLGYIPDDDARDLLCGAHALCYPSYFEGFGLPVIEAMACGTPVICSDRGGLREVAGDCAYTIDPNDLDSIADALRQLAEDKELATRLTRAGSRNVQRFSWSITATKTAEYYLSLIRGS